MVSLTKFVTAFRVVDSYHIIYFCFLSRRLLQMGIYNAEVFNNLGLSCFYAQQYDVTIKCFERALSIATDEQSADVWYNISHVALVSSGGHKQVYAAALSLSATHSLEALQPEINSITPCYICSEATSLRAATTIRYCSRPQSISQ